MKFKASRGDRPWTTSAGVPERSLDGTYGWITPQ